MAEADDMILSIKTTLAQLYTKLHRSLAQKERNMVMQEISTLEDSLQFWEKRQAIANGSRPRVADINLGGF